MRLGMLFLADLTGQCFAKINPNQTTTRARARNERLIPGRNRRLACGHLEDGLTAPVGPWQCP